MTNTKKESLSNGLRYEFEQDLKDFLKQRFNLEYNKKGHNAQISDITISLSRENGEDILEVYNKQYNKKAGLGFFISYEGNQIKDEMFNFATGGAAKLVNKVNEHLMNKYGEYQGKNAYYAFDIIEGLVKNLLNKK